jgi:glycosyltransferase involved in cell wall biosynthesis
MKQIEISIIVAVFNAEFRIRRVLDSLLNQEYNKKYEIILVNDESTDNTLRILREYENKYNNIHVFNQKNKGASFARNVGIKHAKGKILVISDDDGVFEKSWLSKTIPILTDKKIGLVCTIIKNNLPDGLNYFEDLLFDYAQVSRGANKSNEKHMFMSNAIKKETMESIKGYDVSFDNSAAGADLDLVVKLEEKGYKIGESNAVVLHLEEKKRFKPIYFLKKSYSWGKAYSHFLFNHKKIIFCYLESLLAIPIPLFLFLTLGIMSYFIWQTIFAYISLIIIYFYIRRKLISGLIHRNRNIFDIFFVSIFDIVRILLYNLGSISYLLSSILFKKSKK